MVKMTTITCPECGNVQRAQNDEVLDDAETRCPSCGITGFYSERPERESICCGSGIAEGQCIACGSDGRHFFTPR